MKKSNTEPIKTVLVISMGFLVIFWFTQWSWVLAISLVVGLTGVFSDYLSKKLDWFWAKLTYLLSLIIPNILLSVVYYLILFPISLLSRAFNQSDPLMLKNKLNSTFITSQKSFDKASFKKLW